MLFIYKTKIMREYMQGSVTNQSRQNSFCVSKYWIITLSALVFPCKQARVFSEQNLP